MKLTKRLSQARFAVALVPLLLLAILGPAGAVTLNPGDILIGDPGAVAIIRVDPATGAQTVISSGGNFVEPLGLAVDPKGQILVVDAGLFGTGKIIRVDSLSGAQTVVSSGGLFVRPFDLTIDAAGQILVVDADAFGGSGGIIRVDPTTGAQTVVSTGGNFAGPDGITLDTTGQIIVADADAFGGGGGIIRVDPVSGAQTVISSGGSFVGPSRVVVDPTGQIFVSDQSAFRTGTTIGAIFEVDPMTGAQTVIYNSSGGAVQGPAGLAFDAAGQILVAFHGHPYFDVPDGVARIDPVTGAQTIVSLDGDFGAPFGIAVVRVIPTLTVAIDIKPGSFPNSINPRSRGRIPVGILSSPTFDALASVNPASLTFGRTGDEASLAFCNSSPQDVNGDGLLDLVCHFSTQAAGFQAGDTQGILKGQTVSATPLMGTDSVRIVP